MAVVVVVANVDHRDDVVAIDVVGDDYDGIVVVVVVDYESLRARTTRKRMWTKPRTILSY